MQGNSFTYYEREIYPMRNSANSQSKDWRRAALVVLLLCSPLAAFGQGASGPLITQAVDETKLSRLAGNTHPLALPQFDRGPAPLDLPMQRMLLVLKRSPEQEATLESLVQEQQYKLSTNFHKWLTPDEFGQQFGPSDQDIQTVTSWLASHGFQIARVSSGRNVIEFSGTAAQVQEAFHTTIHSYVVNGEQHWANASDPQIPAALAPAVAGVDSLNNFAKKAAHRIAGMSPKLAEIGNSNTVKPALTFQCGVNNNGALIYCNAVTPYDFATIYNVLPLWTAATPIDGTGQTIALVGRSNINIQDVRDFRNLFGLPVNDPVILLDGPDPGLVPGDETEADLDVELSGGVAKGATIKLVVSESTETTDGVDLSALYIVDNDVAPVMSASFSQCELFLGTTGNQFYSNLWEQAAAEGISVFVSTGDQGSAACDFFQGIAPQPAKDGLQVSGLASTPYNVAVGGTDFNDFFNPLTYWSTSNNPTTQESARGYIPETSWNESCTNAIFGQLGVPGLGSNPETNCNDSRLLGYVETIGGSGGKSGCITSNCSGGYAKPSWQTGSGVPSDNARDLPDVSLFASAGFLNNAYAFCEADAIGACTATHFGGIGGTSASSPAFAGLMALVDQKTGTRQGNPNFILYKLAARQSASSCNSSTGPASTCVFNDVTSGMIAMPCATGSPNCNTSNGGDQFGVLSGYNTGAGYDLATGLGSVNAANMVNNWNTVTFTPSVTTLTLNGGSAVNITHGSPVNVAVSVSPASPRPTGDVSLIATQGANTFGFDTMTLSGGAASGTTDMLPGGTSYTVKAHYEGDGTYGGSDSNAVTVTVSPEASKTSLRVVTFNPSNGQITNPNATTFPYGSFYLLRADVMNGTGTSCFSSSSSSLAYACPTGTVSLTDNGSALGSGAFGLNSQGYTEDQALFQSPTAQFGGGTHSMAGNYRGDNSYTASSAMDSITVTPATTTTSFQFPQGNGMQVIIGSPTTSLSAQATSLSSGVIPTGTFTFFDGTAQLSGTSARGGCFTPTPDTVCSQASVSATISAPPGQHNLTVQYSGDTNYAASTSAPVTVNAIYGIAMTVSANPSNVIYGQGTIVTATINTTNPASNASLKPTGTILFVDGTGKSLTPTIVTSPDANGNWMIRATAATVPQAIFDSISVSYSGDSNYEASNGGFEVTVTIPDFSISASSTPLAITAGQTGTTTITIMPTTSFTSTVALGCGNGSSIPGATCSISPSSVTLSNNTPATATLTISTLAPSSSTSAVTAPAQLHASGMMLMLSGREIWWTLSFLTGLAALLLIAPPSRRRSLHAALGLALVCLLTFALGCGGGASASGPPVPTTTTLSVPSTKVAQGSIVALTATVNSSKPVNGFVNVSAPNCGMSSTPNVVNGTAQEQVAFQVPGTCVFTAQYSGDLNHESSQSGNLNIAITGITSQSITGQTGPLSHPISVSVTIQ